jgi:hypothetical protein
MLDAKESPMTPRNGDGTSVELIRSEMDAEARQQMATRKLRALIQTDENRDPEIRRLLKSISAYDVAKQFGLL